MEPVPSAITKKYPARGPLQQFRFADSTAFTCFRCGDSKKSKLITIYSQDWAKRLCNGCYGRLLSLYEIKAGADPEDEKCEKLAAALISVISLDERRKAEHIFQASESRAAQLSSEALKFIATAEHVAQHLESMPQLEWSPAVIGLCKAVEAEIVLRVLKPLAARASSMDLAIDKKDADLGKVASYCADNSRKTPELGTIAHFLQVVSNSLQRRQTSALIGCYLKLLAEWQGSHWLLEKDGLYGSLKELTTEYRNKAAHTEELSQDDYTACRSLTIGKEGLLWKLLVSVQEHK